MPKQYVHKQTEIEAIQLTPDTFEDCLAFVGETNTGDGTSKEECRITLLSEEGEREISNGDYIIKGVLNKVYPCSAEVFDESYDVKE